MNGQTNLQQGTGPLPWQARLVFTRGKAINSTETIAQLSAQFITFLSQFLASRVSALTPVFINILTSAALLTEVCVQLWVHGPLLGHEIHLMT